MSLVETAPTPVLAGAALRSRSDPLNPWTEERVEKLRVLWHEGYSATQIIGLMDHPFTRNAILGKVDRLKLSHDPSIKAHAKYGGPPATKNWRPDSFRRKPQPSKPRQYVSIFDAPAHVVGRTETACEITALSAGDRKCRYPFGEPGEADFAFCGQPAADPCFGAYCAGHSRICYQPRR